jgi:hypothetical protein
VGVGLLSKQTSIKIYNKQTHYNQWEFVYDYSQNALQATAGASTNLNGASNSTNGASGTGFGSGNGSGPGSNNGPNSGSGFGSNNGSGFGGTTTSPGNPSPPSNTPQ